ncbi:MAG: ribonuclease [Betaproteobacteria bacterium]|nr:ribonuclease [Betaproteobacteria bacterium]
MRIAALLIFAWLIAIPALAPGAAPEKEIAPAELPLEARQTLELIRKGGPYPYKQDGVVFGNREKLLPQKARGYYQEYTVKTPGSRDRGARRIVAGRGKSGDVKTAEEYWYTDDHYASFKRIVDAKGK